MAVLAHLMTAEQRMKVERAIAEALVRSILGAGLHVEVNDGEEDVLAPSRDFELIMAAMFSTDEDYLFVYRGPEAPSEAFVHLVYGNEGWDVISNYTARLEELVGPASDVADRYEMGIRP